MYNTNQFTPYGRQPYYVPSYQPVIPQQSEMVFSDVRILTADQIKGFIPPINSKVLLIDKDNGIAYVETTDTMGNMYKEAYSYGKVKSEQTETKQDMTIYATKQDIEELKKEMESLRKTPTTSVVKENVQAKQ